MHGKSLLFQRPQGGWGSCTIMIYNDRYLSVYRPQNNNCQDIVDLVQDCSKSSALEMELLQSCAKPSNYDMVNFNKLKIVNMSDKMIL